MEFLLDTINIEQIKKYNDIIALSGVTSNPSIVKKEGKIDFFSHVKTIRKIIGKEKTLHIQVVSKDYEGMLKDAETVLDKVDSEVYIKVPVNEVGLKVIKELKSRGVHVTATAVYSKFQAYLAIAAGADYIAPYYNRMENLNIDSDQVIADIAFAIDRSGAETKILAASFKNVGQINHAFEAGAQAATMAPDLISSALGMPSIGKAVNDFTSDWESIFGKDSNIASL